MIPFAIQAEGITEIDQARWVLEVDPAGERFLVALSDSTFVWVEMGRCKLVKAATPDQPQLVLPVQAQPVGSQVVIPNRAMRRAIPRNGDS